MNLEELEIYLHHINVIEQKQQQTGVSIVDVGNISLTDFDAYYENGIFRFPKTLFFQGTQNIYISRHNRFAPMIEHVHDFIEMTYVYQGTCTQIIKGQKIELSQGSLCVLDRDVPHAIEPLGEADILINVLINEQTFSSLFLYKLEQDSSLLASFLADAFNQQANHDQFIIFDTSHYRQIHTQFQLMLAEYWGYGHHSEQFVAHYLQLIFMESLRIYEDKQRKILNRYKFKYTEVLDYIDSHYQQLKLAELANIFGYNSNYLSNMLKKYTGKNFQEILLEKRLLLASDLLIHSDHTIDHIAEEAGFNSVNYFFRQFKKRYQCTPNQYRKQKR